MPKKSPVDAPEPYITCPYVTCMPFAGWFIASWELWQVCTYPFPQCVGSHLVLWISRCIFFSWNLSTFHKPRCAPSVSYVSSSSKKGSDLRLALDYKAKFVLLGSFPSSPKQLCGLQGAWRTRNPILPGIWWMNLLLIWSEISSKVRLGWQVWIESFSVPCLLSAWGHIVYCELADVYSSAGTFLQFTNQDVSPPFRRFQKVQSKG